MKSFIRFPCIKSRPLKAQPNPLEPFTPKARQAARDVVMDLYGMFVDMVAERRGMDRKKVLKLADGRVYTGRQAKANGLVDALGGEAEARDWLDGEVRPLLAAMDPSLQSYFGQDFGRVSDLSVIWPIQLQHDLTRRPPFTVELRNIPFAQQRQILFYILHRLPRFMAGAMDAGGNGAQLAEEAADEFGHDRIEQIKFSVEWYRENMPSFVRAFEDATIALPRDADVLADHRQLKKVDGVVRVPNIRTQDTQRQGKKRHGDSAIANALANFASIMETHKYAYQAATPPGGKFDEPANWDDDHRAGSGLAAMTGAW